VVDASCEHAMDVASERAMAATSEAAEGGTATTDRAASVHVAGSVQQEKGHMEDMVA